MISIGIFFILGLAALLAKSWSNTRVSSRDLAWIANSAVISPAERVVYNTYLTRVRRYRFAGGLVGVLFAVIVGVRYYSSIDIRIGKNGPLSDVLFCGLAGVLIGSDAAEHFRMREPKSSSLAVSLAERGVKLDRRIVAVARALTVATILVGAVAAVTGRGLTLLGVALAGLTLQVVTEQTRQAVIGRRRLVLSPEAHEVDLRIRTVACNTATWSQLASAVMMVGWTISKLPATNSGAWGLVRATWVIACLIGTIVLLIRAKPGPAGAWHLTRSGARTIAGPA